MHHIVVNMENGSKYWTKKILTVFLRVKILVQFVSQSYCSDKVHACAHICVGVIKASAELINRLVDKPQQKYSRTKNSFDF